MGLGEAGHGFPEVGCLNLGLGEEQEFSVREQCYPTEPVLNSGSAALHLKINTRRTRDGGRGKVALFRKPAIWVDSGLVSQGPSSLCGRSQEVLKGKT